jgi:hypothetical protein
VSEQSVQSPVRQGDLIAGKYRVERVLGAGGMGIVVAATHVELHELVALKFLLPDALVRKDVCTRFAREARTGIRIKNEHVARVFDVGSLPDGAPYMVMEHLVGEDLAAMIERCGALPVTEAVDLLLQACEAVCEAHRIGVVHRDLKPGNLFVTTGSDGMPFVKVLDFGISKSVSMDDVAVTDTSAVLGSPLYMSPEQLTSSRDVDPRSDLWSIGVILYEMLTGHTPYARSSFPILCAAILLGKYRPMSELRPDLPVALDEVMASILVVDREARVGSVEELSRRVAPFGSPFAEASRQRIARIAARSGAPPVSDHDAIAAAGLATTEERALPEARESGKAGLPGRDTANALTRSTASPGRVGGSRAAIAIAVGVVVAGGIAAYAGSGRSGAIGGTTVSSAAPSPSVKAVEGALPRPDELTPLPESGVTGVAAQDASFASGGPSIAPSSTPPRRDPSRPAPAAGPAAHTPAPARSADDLFNSQK